MAGLVPVSALRRTRYNGTVRSSIWERLFPAAALLLALPAGACSYQLGVLNGHDKSADKTEVTVRQGTTAVTRAL